jgi:hypothetical protein
MSSVPSWTLTATGDGRGIDAQEVRRALGILLDPQGCHELRSLPSGRSRLVRASDLDHAVAMAETLADGKGVYWTLNPVRPDLGDHAAKVEDVQARRWLLIDCDRAKASDPDSMATQEEKDQAVKLAGKVCDWLIDQGWPLPIMVDSGNGQHLLYRVDLPANDHSRVLIGKALKTLAERWKDEPATIDTKMANANRISKLPGTWARKGANTPERPWRLAHLIFEPDVCEVVTLDQLERVAGIGTTPAGPEGDPLAWLMTARGGPDRVETYVRSAIEREIVRVVLASEGTRNDQLNSSAFALGQLVGGHYADRADIERQLSEAARRSGLGEDEIRRTIASGLGAGIAQPRVLPESVLGGNRPGRNGKHEPPADTSLIILASQVKTRKVEWLWPNRIPIGKLTTFAGWGGLGKSFVTMDLASRISRGDEIPGLKGECFDTGSVLILNTEDDPDDTSVPRLIEAGADLRRIGFARSEVLGQFTLADLRLLDRMLGELGDVKLLVIDPATAHLGNTKDNSNAELRGLLMPLSLWAMERRIAVVLVTHVNKPQQSKVEAMARVVGSVAWVNAVRAAVMFARDPEDKSRRLFIPFKSNNSPEQKGLAYRVVATDSLARIEWMGEVDTSADEALNHEKPSKRQVVAADWLTDRFRDKLRWFSDDLFTLAKSEGISRNAIFEAKKTLRLPTCDQEVGPGGKKAFVWWVPENWPPLQNERDSGTVGHCDPNPLQDQGQRTDPAWYEDRDTDEPGGTVASVPVSHCPSVPLSQRSIERDSGNPDWCPSEFRFRGGEGITDQPTGRVK